MRKYRMKSYGQIVSDVDVQQWKYDLEAYAKYRKWADEGSSWAASACERILSRYPENLHKHFTE